jgi:hypothetical protein
MRAANPTPKPPTWMTSVYLLVWSFLFGPSGLGDPASNYATADMARWVIKTRKHPNHVKVIQ